MGGGGIGTVGVLGVIETVGRCAGGYRDGGEVWVRGTVGVLGVIETMGRWG